jgi:hypothetical protein
MRAVKNDDTAATMDQKLGGFEPIFYGGRKENGRRDLVRTVRSCTNLLVGVGKGTSRVGIHSDLQA